MRGEDAGVQGCRGGKDCGEKTGDPTRGPSEGPAQAGGERLSQGASAGPAVGFEAIWLRNRGKWSESWGVSSEHKQASVYFGNTEEAGAGGETDTLWRRLEGQSVNTHSGRIKSLAQGHSGSWPWGP